MRVVNCPNQNAALTNCVYISPGISPIFESLPLQEFAYGQSDILRLRSFIFVNWYFKAEDQSLGKHLEIGNYVFRVTEDPAIESGCIGLNVIHRRILGVSADNGIADVSKYESHSCNEFTFFKLVWLSSYYLEASIPSGGSGIEILPEKYTCGEFALNPFCIPPPLFSPLIDPCPIV